MILKRILLAVLVLLAVVITTVYFLPATWIASLVAQGSGNRLLLTEARGRALSGYAQLALSSGQRERAYNLGQVSWKLDWLPLLKGQVTLHFQSELLTQPLDLQVNGGNWVLAANRIVLPLQALASLGEPFNTLGLRGQASLQWDNWLRQSGKLSGRAVLDINQVSSELSNNIVVGSYQAKVGTLGNDAVNIDFQTREGPLFVEGKGEWDGRLTFSGRVKVADAASISLQPLLRLLGPNRGDHIPLELR